MTEPATRMNADVRQLWVDALRSGRFQQGHYRLATVQTDDVTASYCCLGVLCELARDAGVPLTVDERPGSRTYDGERNYLPAAVLEWAGLRDGNPAVTWNDRRWSLSVVNDGSRLPFAAIARIVEEQL